MRRPVQIIARIVFDDGEECHVSMSDEGISRWGNSEAVLGDAVDVTETMLEALQMQDLAFS
jgi:hypothetical protein